MTTILVDRTSYALVQGIFHAPAFAPYVLIQVQLIGNTGIVFNVVLISTLILSPKPFDMADYNRNRRDQNWERQNRNREYDEFGSFDRTNYNREDWEQYRRQNIAGYDPYTGHDYGRQDGYGNFANYNENRNDRRDQHSNYGNSSSGDWDRQDNQYGSYNAGYSGNDYNRGSRRQDNDYNDQYNRPYRESGYKGNYGSSASDRMGHHNDDYRQDYQGKDRRNDDYRGDNRNDRSFWERATDEVASWFGVDDDRDRRNRDERNTGPYRGKGPKGYNRSDDRIREDLCDRLSDDPYIDASDINIRVTNGEVVLEGHAENKQAKRRAEDLAERIQGVKNVENHLKVSNASATVGSSKVYSDRQEDNKRNRKSGWF